METLKIFIMAIAQGIGEFLPISSSGHLLVLGKLFFQDGLSDDQLMTLNILLHLGTLLSILLVFRKWIWEMLATNRRLILLIIAGSFPTALIGLFIEKKMEFLSTNLWVAGASFIVTGFLLLKYLREKEPATDENAEENVGKENKKTLKTMTYLDALIVGIFQGFAVLPGLSRSGFTITAGIMRKIKQQDAAVFSFLLAIPAIGGATLLDLIDTLKGETGTAFIDANFNLYLFGATVSFIIGILSLVYLMKWLQKGKLYRFAWWLFLIGPAVLIWQLIALWIK